MNLSEKAKEARRAYYRDYYKKNKDKHKKADKQYWEKKASEAKKNSNLKENQEVI